LSNKYKAFDLQLFTDLIAHATWHYTEWARPYTIIPDRNDTGQHDRITPNRISVGLDL